ncbi:MAG: lactate utilization protein B/C [Bacteroidetes bacterium]|nr:lactate utilization protein B/C [Bacteroidota bacterium]MDA0937281.1 lactate utilization protein B/C [Bacteroidota bacterium]MDA1345418.1 lactate utilization protein B/C [Bacteroidota bacterium]
MPQKKDPVEIEFAKKFTEKGGKFIFTETREKVLQNFENILLENQWKREDIACLNHNLAAHFDLQSQSLDSKKHKALLMTCECLIANKGAFLVCQHQIETLSINQLPEQLIIYASADQFARDVSEGMSKLKQKYFGNLPTNITNLTVKSNTDKDNFLAQGTSSKNIYLLLQD